MTVSAARRPGTESMVARAAVIFAGGFIGTAARVAVTEAIGHEAIALATVNLTGCLVIGLISGYFGPRVTLLRLFLAVGGVASFTSWSSLALQGVASPGAMILVVAETMVGIIVAGLGHLYAMKRLRRGGS